MKRWFAMVAAVTAAVLLAALCIPLLRSDSPPETTAATTPGTNGSRPTGTESKSDPTEQPETCPYTVNIQRIPEAVENPDNLPVLKWVCLNIFTNNKEEGRPGDPTYIPRMTEEVYIEMLQKFKAAGSEKIQAELQRQLDEWLAENPDWQ